MYKPLIMETNKSNYLIISLLSKMQEKNGRLRRNETDSPLSLFPHKTETDFLKQYGRRNWVIITKVKEAMTSRIFCQIQRQIADLITLQHILFHPGHIVKNHTEVFLGSWKNKKSLAIWFRMIPQPTVSKFCPEFSLTIVTDSYSCYTAWRLIDSFDFSDFPCS